MRSPAGGEAGVGALVREGGLRAVAAAGGGGSTARAGAGAGGGGAGPPPQPAPPAGGASWWGGGRRGGGRRAQPGAGGVERAQRLVERGEVAGLGVVGEDGADVVLTAEHVLHEAVQRLLGADLDEHPGTGAVEGAQP